jgi:7,8-dihydro-6-hydroxymethylpterin-pyrophosphokinase
MLHLRNFVLVPMLDIAANFKHPTLKQTIRELTAICPDNSAVKKCGT